jgi:GDP-D-mannose dehydratase
MRLPSEVFGDINGAAADESTPFSPSSPYAVAKATTFWEVANYREADIVGLMIEARKDRS